MCENLSPHDIGIALQQKGLLPYVKDLNIYGIYSEGEEYEVFTERLPEVYLRKRVPTETYVFQERPWLLACAMNRINALDSPVRVWADSEKVTFTLYIEPTSFGAFQAGLPRWLAFLELAADQLGQACEVLLREDEQHDLEAVTEQLCNPSQDSPWLRGQKIS